MTPISKILVIRSWKGGEIFVPGLCEAAASEFIGHTWWEVIISDQWNKQHRVAHLISFLLIDDRLISVLRKVIRCRVG